MRDSVCANLEPAVPAAGEHGIPVRTWTRLPAMRRKIQSLDGGCHRAFFCGGIALHRDYMGTGGKSMWWFYLCVPVAGGVDACVDFWWVVFKGSEAMDKYKDNSKFFVWTGN